ncbi:hypothetical protein FFT09_22620 [Saccharomonospora piscinae]|uniref:hypothetical protein n=1 Tax=Saccharomonospora piscinae TaxID=687388 RepID=UPI001105AEF0|nr:hypothetical protein [Saccharomonospora piscinae]TLW89228.1 hypothetical protein FFT09_22620 [Saccharomonospora piscinae]
MSTSDEEEGWDDDGLDERYALVEVRSDGVVIRLSRRALAYAAAAVATSLPLGVEVLTHIAK